MATRVNRNMGRGPDAYNVDGESAPRYGDLEVTDQEDVEEDEEREPIIPDGYESEGEFLAYWLKQHKLDMEADKHNRDEAMEDLRFTYVDQWDEETRAEREEAGRPCMTINTLPQFIGQVVGDRRINKTTVKVIPATVASKKQAEVRSGLIQAVFDFSDAERVFDSCCEDQVAAGISNFQVELDYAFDDVFEQDIFVRQLYNPFGVTWDRMSRDVTGKDARHCFVEDAMPKDVFEEEFPGIGIPTGFPHEQEGADWSTWCGDEMVKVTALWIMIEKPAVFAMMQDGEVEEVTDKPEIAYLHRVQIHPIEKVPMIREGYRRYAQRWLITGFTILEGPYELPLSRLPVIKVSGRVGRVGTKQYRFGLIRWARDPSLLRNYWRSIAAETLALAPKNQWLAEEASVKGREDDFRTAHITGDPLLVYNTGKNPPKRENPPNLPTAVLQEATMNAQDIKDVTGIHDASLGIRSNEVSGKAIMARQREGDVATITFHDNLNLAIKEAGDVTNQLIPIAYDTIRNVRFVGPDEQLDFVNINDPDDENSPDVTMGKYTTKLVTGPSFTTQRMEAQEFMLEMTKTMPELMAQAADITMESMDVPGAERLAGRFRKIIPAAQQEEQERQQQEAQASGQPPQPSPEEMQAAKVAQMQAEMMEAQMQAQMEEMRLKLREQDAKTREAEARAIEAEARAEQAGADIRTAQAKADKAEADADKAEEEVIITRHERVAGVREREQQPEPSRDNAKSGKRRSAKGNPNA